jgi:DNA-binding FadR family transcriptional regulator
MITSGEVGPGDRLPTERDLTTRLGLSRSTVREAIRSLELLGVVDSRHGDGTYVRKLDASLVLEATGFVSRLVRDDDALEMFDVRAVLDSAAASLAAARLTADERDELQRHFDAMLSATTPETYLEADMAFHAHVAACSGNRLLAALLDSFSVRTHPMRLHTQVFADSNQLAIVHRDHDEHARILESILRRDPLGASIAAAAHAHGAGKDWVKFKDSVSAMQARHTVGARVNVNPSSEN